MEKPFHRQRITLRASLTPQLRRGSLAFPNLHTTPAPVLTPSISEDAEDAEGAEVGSIQESTASKRSRSLTRRMVDLQIAKKPVVPKTATSSTDAR